MPISGVAASEIHVHQQFAQPCHSTLLLSALSSVHPGEDAAISIGEFLQFNALRQGHRFAKGNSLADLLKS